MPKVTIADDGRMIVVDFPDLAAALRVFRTWTSPEKRTEFARKLEETMRLLELDLQVRVAGKPVDSFGPHAQSGLLRRVIGPAV